MKTTTIIMTAVLAGAAGALAGIIFAPGKSSTTRGKIILPAGKITCYQ